MEKEKNLDKEALNENMFSAIEEGRLADVKKALEMGADINAVNDKGWSPLTLSISTGKSEFAKFLIENGADIAIKTNSSNWKALYFASEKGDAKITKMLLQKEVDTKAKNEALLIAAKQGNIDIARLLLESGADVNAKDADGWTPLHYAAWNYKKELVQLLIENGADAKIKSKSGKMPLDFGNIEIKEIMLSIPIRE